MWIKDEAIDRPRGPVFDYTRTIKAIDAKGLAATLRELKAKKGKS